MGVDKDEVVANDEGNASETGDVTQYLENWRSQLATADANRCRVDSRGINGRSAGAWERFETWNLCWRRLRWLLAWWLHQIYGKVDGQRFVIVGLIIGAQRGERL